MGEPAQTLLKIVSKRETDRGKEWAVQKRWNPFNSYKLRARGEMARHQEAQANSASRAHHGRSHQPMQLQLRLVQRSLHP